MTITSCAFIPMLTLAALFSVFAAIFITSEWRNYMRAFRRIKLFDFSGFQIAFPLAPVFAMLVLVFLGFNKEVKVGNTVVAKYKSCDETVACQLCKLGDLVSVARR